MTILEYMAKYGDDFASDEKPLLKPWWDEVSSQAEVHTRGAYPVKIVEEQRPHEPDEVRAYVLQNYRPITVEATNKAKDHYTRAVLGSSWTWGPKLSTAFDEWKEEKSLIFNSESISLSDFFAKVVVPAMLEDPNALLIPIPYVLSAHKIPPSDSRLDGTEKLGIRGLLIPSDRRRIVKKNAISWRAEKNWKYKDINGEEKERHYYWFVNSYAYYRILPSVNAKNELIYTSHVWYVINSTKYVNEVKLEEIAAPTANILGGNITKTFKIKEGISIRKHWKGSAGDDKYYYRSFIDAHFNWSDLRIGAFRDWQSVSIQHNYPIRAMIGATCETCQGRKKVQVLAENNTHSLQDCHTCRGVGRVISINPHDTLEIPMTEGTDGSAPKPIGVPIVQYYNPDVSILESSRKTPNEYGEQAKLSIYIDMHEGTPQESGVAKDIRENQFRDMLRRVGDATFETKQLFAWQVEQILNPVPTQRIKPLINKPVEYKTKTVAELIEDAKESPRSNRLNAELNLINVQHKSDPVMIKVKTAHLYFSPSLMWTDEEASINYQNMQPIDRAKEHARFNYGQLVIEEIAQASSSNFLSKGISEIMKEAEVKIADYVTEPPPLEPLVSLNDPDEV